MVLTQTHPSAPYVCRTGNITLRCQYGGVENVLGVLWILGNEAGTPDPTNIPGNTALPPQELVVDNYTNLLERYQCAPVLINGTTLNSNEPSFYICIYVQTEQYSFAPKCMPMQFNVQILIFYYHHNRIISILHRHF